MYINNSPNEDCHRGRIETYYVLSLLSTWNLQGCIRPASADSPVGGGANGTSTVDMTQSSDGSAQLGRPQSATNHAPMASPERSVCRPFQ